MEENEKNMLVCGVGLSAGDNGEEEYDSKCCYTGEGGIAKGVWFPVSWTLI